MSGYLMRSDGALANIKKGHWRIAIVSAFLGMMLPLDCAPYSFIQSLLPEALAQELPQADAHPPMSGAAFWTSTLLYVSVGWLLFYILVVKPKAKEEDQQKKFIAGLKKGDEVFVNSSILGKVVVVKPDVITVELAPEVKVRVLPSALSARQEIKENK